MKNISVQATSIVANTLDKQPKTCVLGNKLNKGQYDEFARSGINREYADVNFRNCTSKLTAAILNPNNEAGKALMYANPIANGGWIDIYGHIFKPKLPRNCEIKYETLISGKQFWEVKHPKGVTQTNQIYFCEGMKKGVAVAQHFGGRVLVFDSLGHGLGLLDEFTEEAAKFDEVYFCPDNDDSTNARNKSKSIAKAILKGCPQAKVAKYFGKGIDDALVDGAKAVKWVDLFSWQPVASSCTFWDKIETKRYISTIEILKGIGLYVIKGEKGTGKSYQMELRAREAIAEGRTVIVVVHRISLGMDLAKRLGIPYIDDIDYKGTGSVALCINSIQKLTIDDSLAGAVMFIDESDQVVKDMWFSDTMKVNRPLIVNQFKELGSKIVNNYGGSIVIASADISESHVKQIQELFDISKASTYKIWNQYIPKKGDCYFSLGVPKTKDSSEFKQYDGVLKVLEMAKAGSKLYIHVSAQKEESIFSATVLELLLNTALGDKTRIVRIDSETNKNPEHPAFRAASNIKQICLSHDIVIATNTIGTGVDINLEIEEKLSSKPHFDAVITFANGVTNDSDSARQAIARYRNFDVDRYVFTQPDFDLPKDRKSFMIYDPLILDNLEKDVANYFKATDEDFYSYQIEQKGDILDLSRKSLMKHNVDLFNEARNFGLILRNKLEALDNYTVIDYKSPYDINQFKAIHQTLKELSAILQSQRSLEIEQANPLTEEEYKTLKEKQTKTTNELMQISAFLIRKQYGLEPTQQVQELIKDKTISRLKNNWFLTDGFEIGLLIKERNNYHRSKNGLNDLAFDFAETNIPLLKVAVLKEVDFINRCKLITREEQLELLADIIKASPNSNLLFSIPQDFSVEETKRLDKLIDIAKTFGFNLESKVVKRNGKSDRVRYLTEIDKIDSTDNLSIKEKLFKHWTNYYNTKAQAWIDLKTDFKSIKQAKRLDVLDASQVVGQNPSETRFKYTNLATRARCLGLISKPPRWNWAHESPKEFKAWLNRINHLAIDIETYSSDPKDKKGGLNHVDGCITIITLSDGDNIWIAKADDLSGMFSRDFRLMMARRNQRKVGHNFMFDLRFLSHKGLIGKIRNVADTMLGSRCLLGDLGAAQITKHSLKQACLNFLGIEISKDEQTSDWSGELTQAQLDYAANDAWFTFVLDKRLQELCANPTLIGLPMPKEVALKHWELRNATLPAFNGMELTGYVINKNKEIIEKQRSEKLTELKAQWSKLVPGIKHTQSQKLLEYVNKKYGLDLQSLNKQNIVGDAKVRELELRQTIIAIEKDLDILNKVSAVGERHKPVITACSGTGRTSSGATRVNKRFFNMQSLPARVNPAIPKAFGFLPLKAMFNTDCIIDLPASHGRISAELANDDYAIHCYTDETVDMHCDTASIIAQIVYNNEEAAKFTSAFIKENCKATDTEDGRKAKGLRDTAKNTYYGWLNGAGAGRIKDQIQNNLGIAVSKDKCQQALNGMQQNFRKTVEYSQSILKQLENISHQFIVDGSVCAYMEFSGVYLCWRLGKVGVDLKIPATKAFASIWSCTESLLMNQAIADIHEVFEANPQWGARLQNFIHDEINLEYKDVEAAQYAYKLIKQHFAEICPNTVLGFDKFEKCIKTKEKSIQTWSDK